MSLQTPLKQGTNRAYKMMAGKLEKIGIFTLEDFLFHFPSRYEDYSVISQINKVQPGETVTIQGKIIEFKNQYLRGARIRTMQKAKVSDDSGVIELAWFNQPFLSKTLFEDSAVSISGKAELNGKKLTITSPEFEVLYGEDKNPIHTGRLVPIYPETKGVTSKWLRRQIYRILLQYKTELEEYLPEKIIGEFQFLNFADAIKEIHFPGDPEKAERARARLSFEELFLLQMASNKRRKEWQENNTGKRLSIDKYRQEIDKFTASLPFTLTGAQSRSVKEILQDLNQEKQMNRLLQGDVGSGKTVVAAIAMYAAFLNGYQSIFMAPTEILAQQHFATISKLLEPFGIEVELLTGSNNKIKQKKPAGRQGRSKSKNSEEKKLDSKFLIHTFSNKVDIIIGTHALLSEKVKLDRLALVVIDEQQKFGVEQRALIRKKGEKTHLLTMTATPIPRTVALTMYGELDLSYLNEMPVGRQKVKTWLVQPEKREGAYRWIRKQVEEKGSQIFIICPFIEESASAAGQTENALTVKAATKEFELLRSKIFPDLKLGLLHGKLKAKDKERVMADFKDKKTDILVATPVVEVGIDIANATVIMIETSERFGLAQLHQLRGRVGRGEKQSYCLLFSESTSETTTKRLKALETIYSGAELSELDLRLRGHGDLFGTAQHGIPKLKTASFGDTLLIQKTKHAADEIFPELSRYPRLAEKIEKLTYKEINPD